MNWRTVASVSLIVLVTSCGLQVSERVPQQQTEDAPDPLLVALVRGAEALWEQENYEDALGLVDHSIEQYGQTEILVEFRCDLLFKLRRAEELLEATMLLERIAEKKTAWNYLKIADAHVFLGNKDEAIDWIEKAVRERSFRKYKVFDKDYYEVIKEDPRFINLIDEILEDRGIGQPAKDFTLTLTDGSEFTLSSLKGNVTLLDFWATWCAPCKKELPNLKQLYAEFHSKGFEIVGIGLDEADQLERAESFIKDNDIPWSLSLSGKAYEDEVAKMYRINGLPSLWLIDRDGILREQDIHGAELKVAVERMVHETTRSSL